MLEGQLIDGLINDRVLSAPIVSASATKGYWGRHGPRSIPGH